MILHYKGKLRALEEIYEMEKNSQFKFLKTIKKLIELENNRQEEC